MRTPFRIGSALVFGLLLSWVSRVHGQAIIYNANGFEPPTFTTGVPPNPLAGYNASQTPGGQGAGAQDGWSTTDQNQILYPLINNPAGYIQTSIVQGGTQAFRVQGDRLINDMTFSGGTFWWRYPDSAGNVFNPVANGTPVVVAQTGFRRENSGIPITDIPLQGMYFEGFRTGGLQRQITQLTVDPTGTLWVTSLNALPNSSLSSAPDLVANSTWVNLRVEMNFATQTFQVFLNNTLIGFGPGQTLFTIPFRDTDSTDGPFDRLREYGYVAFFNTLGGITTGDGYFDNFSMTAMAVPEPATYALVGLSLACAGYSWQRRQKRLGKVAEEELLEAESELHS